MVVIELGSKLGTISVERQHSQVKVVYECNNLLIIPQVCRKLIVASPYLQTFSSKYQARAHYNARLLAVPFLRYQLPTSNRPSHDLG